MQLDHTPDASTRSWVHAANVAGGDFPIQNLPPGIFRPTGVPGQHFRGGIAVGDAVVGLATLADTGFLEGLAAQAAAACRNPTLDALLPLGLAAWRTLRHSVFDLLKEGCDAKSIARLRRCLIPLRTVERALPLSIGDYTDFYTLFHHADSIGRLFTIVVSGQGIVRPWGQAMPLGGDEPCFGPVKSPGYELELGFYVGVGTDMRTRAAVDDTLDRLLGLCLLNDLPARDVHLGVAAVRPLSHQELRHHGFAVGSDHGCAGAILLWLVARQSLAAASGFSRHTFESKERRVRGRTCSVAAHCAPGSAWSPPTRIAQSNPKHRHWTVAQMVAHHTERGCNLRPGNLIGTGTIYGPERSQAGAFIDLTQNASLPLQLDDGAGETESRGFVEDGDIVLFKGFCVGEGLARIGFGECAVRILPAMGASEHSLLNQG